MYQRERGSRCFGQKLDSEDDGERREEAGSGAPPARGEGTQVFMELLDRMLGPRVGFSLCRDTNEN
jgi:hypothetical protein